MMSYNCLLNGLRCKTQTFSKSLKVRKIGVIGVKQAKVIRKSPENVTFSGLFHVIFAYFTQITPILRTFEAFEKVGILPDRPHKKQL